MSSNRASLHSVLHIEAILAGLRVDESRAFPFGSGTISDWSQWGLPNEVRSALSLRAAGDLRQSRVNALLAGEYRKIGGPLAPSSRMTTSPPSSSPSLFMRSARASIAAWSTNSRRSMSK